VSSQSHIEACDEQAARESFGTWHSPDGGQRWEDAERYLSQLRTFMTGIEDQARGVSKKYLRIRWNEGSAGAVNGEP